MSESALQLRVLTPLVLWGAHVSVGYVLAALYCHQQFFDWELAGVRGVRVLLIAWTALVAAAALWSALSSYRTWRATPEAADANGRIRFTSGIGAAAAGVLLLYLAWAFVPILVGELCW